MRAVTPLRRALRVRAVAFYGVAMALRMLAAPCAAACRYAMPYTIRVMSAFDAARFHFASFDFAFDI